MAVLFQAKHCLRATWSHEPKLASTVTEIVLPESFASVSCLHQQMRRTTPAGRDVAVGELGGCVEGGRVYVRDKVIVEVRITLRICRTE